MDTNLAIKDELRRLLCKNAKLLGLTVRAIDIIVSRTVSLPLGKGAVICGSHDCADYVRILVQGTAKVTCRPNHGRPCTAYFSAPGEFLCVPQPAKDAGYGIEIVAWDVVTLSVLTRAHMLKAIEALPPSGVGTLLSWSFRTPTQLLFAKLAAQKLPVRVRLMVELKNLARRFGYPVADGVVIDLELSRQDLAELVQASPARTGDAMQELFRQGLVSRLGRKIVVTTYLLQCRPGLTRTK